MEPYMFCVFWFAVGLAIGGRSAIWLCRNVIDSGESLIDVMREDRNQQRVDCIEALRERDNLVAMLSRDFQKKNPGEPEPDWLVVAESSADYRAGKWKTADQVTEELSEVDENKADKGIDSDLYGPCHR